MLSKTCRPLSHHVLQQLMCQYFQLWALCGFISIYSCNKSNFCFASKFGSSGHSLLICSLPMKSRKSLACDATDSSASHANLVHDVTDTDCFTQNGYAHCCFVFTTFRTKKQQQKATVHSVINKFFQVKYRQILDLATTTTKSKTSTHTQT